MKDMFLRPEEKCGHYITGDVKKLWAVEIGCLQKLQEVCKRHGIRYFAAGGTLLGAVRHQGFIPWDDDMDVFMLEQDYKKFCKIAPNEITEPYFFQSYSTQEGFGPSLSRIRKSDTTGCTQFEYETADENYNCGIFIDIFPLTSVSDTKLGRLIQSVNIFRYRAAIAGYERLRAIRRSNNKVKYKELDPLICYWKICSIFMSHTEVSEKFLSACSSGGTNSERVGVISFLGMREKYIFKREWFRETISLPFEYINIDCPSGFDPLLHHQFGDYMVFKKGAAIHTMAVFDAEVPYTIKLYELFHPCS